MAKKPSNDVKASAPAPVLERYPRIEIDRSFAAESSRRNIEVIVWYKRLVNATIALIAASIFFTIVAVLFAFFQPLPSLYGSALDGSLHRIDYVRNVADPRLLTMRSALTSEEVSRTEIDTKKTSAAKLPALAAAAAPKSDAPAAPVTGQSPAAQPTAQPVAPAAAPSAK